MMPTRQLNVKKLSDEFGQYKLQLTCSDCGHERRAYPKSLANILGWDAELVKVEQKLRCSKCGKRACRLRVVEMRAPRGAKPSH